MLNGELHLAILGHKIILNKGSKYVRYTFPDINIGLFYKTRELYFGFSTTHLGGFNMEDLNIQNVHHYWVTAGMTMN